MQNHFNHSGKINLKSSADRKGFLHKIKSYSLLKPIFIIMGLLSLIWFLVRVIPKPSRAAYPCIQTAFPVASAFVIWLTGSLGSIALFRKLPSAIKAANYRRVLVFTFAGLVLFSMAITMSTGKFTFAGILGTEEIVPVKKDYDKIITNLPATVSVVQSDKANASDILYDEILSMVREAVVLAGGLEDIISDGKSVMIKPNLVNYFDYRPIELNGVTTDHRVLQAIVHLVREINPTGKVILAEGNAERVPTLTNFGILKYLEITGVDEFIGFEAFSGGYREYLSDSLHALELPDSLSYYPDNLKPNLSRKIYYNKRYFEADVLITVPVLKNHSNAGITGGVKNIAIGGTPANIYGDKDNVRPYLRSVTIDHNNGNLDRWMHDYYAGRPADFVIFDGLQGVSSGPGGGGNLTALIRNQHNMRLILAGRDVVATDAIAGLIIGHDPQRANHLIYLHNDGFGVVDPALIEVIGVKVHQVRKFLGYENNYTAQTIFDKAVASDYQVTGSIINNNTLHLSVSNPEDLARMQVSVDNQKIDKYIVGGFDDITIDVQNITVTEGKVDVFFEDRYLNPLNKQFIAENITNIETFTQNNKLVLYPNPVHYEINLRMENASNGTYIVRIIDMQGRVIISEAFRNYSDRFIRQLNTENLSKGYYFISLFTPEGTECRLRFLKQ